MSIKWESGGDLEDKFLKEEYDFSTSSSIYSNQIDDTTELDKESIHVQLNPGFDLHCMLQVKDMKLVRTEYYIKIFLVWNSSAWSTRS